MTAERFESLRAVLASGVLLAIGFGCGDTKHVPYAVLSPPDTIVVRDTVRVPCPSPAPDCDPPRNDCRPKDGR